MKGEVVHELEVCLSAEEIWMIYRSLQLSQLVVKLLPNVIHKVEVIEGDGGVGTVIHVHFSSGEFIYFIISFFHMIYI